MGGHCYHYTDIPDQASESGSEETVRVFVRRGLGGQLDHEGRTPLMWATARGATAIIAELAGRVDINTVDNLGYNALHIAVSCDKMDSVSRLLDLGSDPSSATPDGLSSLSLAAQLGHGQVAGLLLDRGARLEQVTCVSVSILTFLGMVIVNKVPHYRVTKLEPHTTDTQVSLSGSNFVTQIVRHL